MNKTLKTLFYILGVCVLLFGFGACASNKPKPEQKPESVKPADSEKNEEQVKTARLLDEMAKARAEAVNVKQIRLILRSLNQPTIRRPKQERVMNQITLLKHMKRLRELLISIVL